ncbi:hypothetical protein UFOVP210_21 [uncultured Caudovirales phage]|uniref:Uncharacterized protein n=1 Tax=uncultured Caudovirales phage TaxID=2100421 RepID=A0A6J7WMD9_9CAUD|nr:hypothetical protein UFOVP210_21 [uncultured Caudovirales phage]
MKSLSDGRYKLTEDDVLSVYAHKGNGWSMLAIASKYKVSYEQIRRILKGDRWKDTFKKYRVEETGDVLW